MMNQPNMSPRVAAAKSDERLAALLVLLQAIAAAANMPLPLGDDWSAYESATRLRLWSIRHAAEMADTAPPAHLLNLANSLTASAAILPYKPDLDAGPKAPDAAAIRADVLAKFAPPSPTAAADVDGEESNRGNA